MSMMNVYWTIRETTKVDIAKANEILTQFGIPTTMMDEVTDRKAVRRGIDQMHNRRGRASNRHISEKIRENSDVAVFGILKCEIFAGIDQSKYSQDTKVKLNKSTGAVEASGVLADQVLTAIQSNRGTYNDNDIRRLCYNVVRSVGGISKRPTGGVYILPTIYADKIDALKNAVAAMVGNSAAVYTERIYDGDVEKQNMAVSVSEDLAIRVSRIMVAVNAIGKQTCRLNTHRASIAELTQLTDMYKNILGEQDTLNELTGMLTDAENKIAEQISKVSVKA